MTTNDAGVRQSQAVTKAAQELSEAKRNYEYAFRHTWNTTRQRDEAKDRLIAARARYAAAYKAYTNPFGVQKTV